MASAQFAALTSKTVTPHIEFTSVVIIYICYIVLSTYKINGPCSQHKRVPHCEVDSNYLKHHLCTCDRILLLIITPYLCL